MPALPIVERELRVAARSRETYWSRSGVVAALGLLWVPGLLGTFGTTTKINTFVFNEMLWAGFGVSCLAFLFTTDSISRERREGTLGLLFLSRVRAGDLLLGKIGSSGFKGLCMLAAFLPMLMIPVLAGGVTGAEAFREGLVLINTFWLSLCVGLWTSAGSLEPFISIRKACVFVGAVVLVPSAAAYCAGKFWFWHAGLQPIDFLAYIGVAGIQYLSPLAAIGFAREIIYKTSPASFWISLGITQGLAWLLLLFAAGRVTRSLRRPTEVTVDRRTHGGVASKRIPLFRAYGNPVDWLVRYQPGIRATLWIACLIEVFYYMSSWAIFRGIISWSWPPIISWVVWFGASASTDALFARAASKFFYDSKRSGQLEMLLTTPIGPGGVMEGQWSALKKLMAWPIAIALAAMLLDEDFTLVTQIGQPAAYNLSWIAQCFLSWAVDITLSIFGVFAVCWTGMLFALKGKNAAATVTLAAMLGTGVPAVFKTLYAFGVERINLGVFGGILSGTISDWGEQIIVTFYYLWLFRVARKAVLRELAGVAPARQRLFPPSRITNHASLHVTRATDATI